MGRGIALAAIRVAVAGTGFIGPVHVEALRRAGAEVVGILGSSLARSKEGAAALGIPTAYASFEELLADDRVESVHLATPNPLHFPQAKAALAAGKHVLCEKPLATTSAEAAELVAAAKKSGKAAGVAYNIRYYPLCREAAERVRRGDLGEILHAGGAYVQDWLLHPTDFNWRVLAEEGGELRAVADVGTHWLDLVQYVTGLKIVSLCADLQTVHPVRLRPTGGVKTFSAKQASADAAAAGDESAPQSAPGRVPVEVTTDDYGSLLFRFENGGRGCMWVSQTTAGRKNCCRFEIAGSRQSLAWESERPNELWIGERDRPNQLLVRDPALLTPAARAIATYPGGHNEGFPDTFKQCFGDFYGYIAAGDFSAPPPFATFEDGRREILLCEAVLKSHRERRWVDVVDTVG